MGLASAGGRKLIGLIELELSTEGFTAVFLLSGAFSGLVCRKFMGFECS